MRVLCKYPTRSRPQQFLKTLRGWAENASAPEHIAFLISCDLDDLTMTPDVIAQAIEIHPSVTVMRGIGKTKIEACNRNLNEYLLPWDVVFLISDDMWCRRRGWDQIIRDAFTKYFPDTDGSLWLYDNSQKKINTLPCMGRKFYDRFGYIYHPTYESFWADNEQTDVGLTLKRLVFIEPGVCTHEQPSWGGGMKRDALYIRNNAPWKADEANYHRRKALGFPA